MALVALLILIQNLCGATWQIDGSWKGLGGIFQCYTCGGGGGGKRCTTE